MTQPLPVGADKEKKIPDTKRKYFSLAFGPAKSAWRTFFHFFSGSCLSSGRFCPKIDFIYVIDGLSNTPQNFDIYRKGHTRRTPWA